MRTYAPYDRPQLVKLGLVGYTHVGVRIGITAQRNREIGGDSRTVGARVHEVKEPRIVLGNAKAGRIKGHGAIVRNITTARDKQGETMCPQVYGTLGRV